MGIELKWVRRRYKYFTRPDSPVRVAEVEWGPFYFAIKRVFGNEPNVKYELDIRLRWDGCYHWLGEDIDQGFGFKSVRAAKSAAQDAINQFADEFLRAMKGEDDG